MRVGISRGAKTKGSLQKEAVQKNFKNFFFEQVSKTPASSYEMHGSQISERNRLCEQKEAMSPIRLVDFFFSSANCKSSTL